MSTMAARRADHPDGCRIAEVRAGRRAGCGYLVGEDTVLTAGRLVRGAADIVAGFPGARGGAWSAPAAIVWLDVEADLAVVRLNAGHGHTGVPPIRYGRLGDPPGRLTVDLAGCGRSGCGQGSVPLTRHRDTLEITLAAGSAPPLPGAAVFAGGLAVGVVTRPPTRIDPRRLLATRLDLRLTHTRHGALLAGLLAAGALVSAG